MSREVRRELWRACALGEFHSCRYVAAHGQFHESLAPVGVGGIDEQGKK